MARLAVGKTPESKSENGLRRLTVNLGSDIYDRVYAAAAAHNVTVTDYLRRALAVQLHFDEHDVEEVRVRERGRDEFAQVILPW